MSAPTSLAIVIPDLRVGGLQLMAVRLARALDAREWLPRVYSFDGGGPLAAMLDEAGIAHVDLPRRPGVDAGYARRLGAGFARDGAALVHCHNITALFHGARAARAAGGLPVLYTEHDREFPAPWRQRLLHRWLARRVDLAVAVSAALAATLEGQEGFHAEELVNGTPDPRADYAGSRSQARAELGWPEVPTLLAVGSLTPVKNHAGLLDLLSGLRARVPELRLAVAGDGPLRKELGRRAAGLPAGCVAWLGERDDVPRLLAACDVFVLPSHSEGLSLSLVEAHGAGRASVAFAVGGNPEVIEDGLTGLLAPVGRGDALSTALTGLLLDPARRASMEAAARERYLAVFTMERMVARYVAHFRALRDQRAAAGSTR
jgi:glycosyltransferase involved in cell wall biosynthesis